MVLSCGAPGLGLLSKKSQCPVTSQRSQCVGHRSWDYRSSTHIEPRDCLTVRHHSKGTLWDLDWNPLFYTGTHSSFLLPLSPDMLASCSPTSE